MFPEASRRGQKVGDQFTPSNTESASALMQAGMLRAGAGSAAKPGKKIGLKAIEAAPRNKDAASLRKNK
jgi:hypothetical protein